MIYLIEACNVRDRYILCVDETEFSIRFRLIEASDVPNHVVAAFDCEDGAHALLADGNMASLAEAAGVNDLEFVVQPFSQAFEEEAS